MTNEERDKTINFILEQQAKVTVDLQQLAEASVAAEKRISRLEGAIVTVVNMIGESNKRTDAKMAEMNEKQSQAQAEFSAKWAETSERLDHFIFALEKYITERRNGTNGQP